MSSSPSVFAISGYSGAGTKKGSEPKISPEDLRGAVRPYALTDHIHEREAGYHLSSLLDFRSYAVHEGRGGEDGGGSGAEGQEDAFKIAFMPHVAPWFQGITTTISVPLNKSLRASEVVELFEQKYEREKLVKVQKDIPVIGDISGKHGVRIGGFQVHSSGKRVVAVVSFGHPFETRSIVGAGVSCRRCARARMLMMMMMDARSNPHAFTGCARQSTQRCRDAMPSKFELGARARCAFL